MRLIRCRFFAVFSTVSGGSVSAMFSLLLLYELPTSLERLARLDLLLEPWGLVLAGTAAEREAGRSVEEKVFSELE